MSSRLEGFDVMDVSTSLPNDPKVRRLAREHPAQLGPGFLAYVATMADSWKAGDRVSVDDAWPSHLPFDEVTIDALKAVKLVDDDGRIPVKAWRGWFTPARKRRESSRKRWRDWKRRQSGKGADLNGKSHGEATADQPFAKGRPTGNRPFLPSESESTPPTPSPARGRRKRSTPSPTDYDALMQRDTDADWMADS